MLLHIHRCRHQHHHQYHHQGARQKNGCIFVPMQPCCPLSPGADTVVAYRTLLGADTKPLHNETARAHVRVLSQRAYAYVCARPPPSSQDEKKREQKMAAPALLVRASACACASVWHVAGGAKRRGRRRGLHGSHQADVTSSPSRS